MSGKFTVDNAKERLLCYSAGILGALLSNATANANPEVPDYMVDRSIKAAKMLIDKIYSEK